MLVNYNNVTVGATQEERDTLLKGAGKGFCHSKKTPEISPGQARPQVVARPAMSKWGDRKKISKSAVLKKIDMSGDNY